MFSEHDSLTSGQTMTHRQVDMSVKSIDQFARLEVKILTVTNYNDGLLEKKYRFTNIQPERGDVPIRRTSPQRHHCDGCGGENDQGL